MSTKFVENFGYRYLLCAFLFKGGNYTLFFKGDNYTLTKSRSLHFESLNNRKINVDKKKVS